MMRVEKVVGDQESDQAFPLIDHHVHLTKEFTIDRAVALSQERNVRFGIVAHPGPQFGLATDQDLERYIEHLRPYPVYVGLQPMYRGWAEPFSQSVLDELDYVLMDADTVPLGGGQYLEIWRHNNYIADLDGFMRIYMDHIEKILRYEPITIFARPTYLPVNFGRYYNELWTEKRVAKMIALARAREIAFEISTPMHVPSKQIILQAKAAGIRFTFGTNARNDDAGKLHYGLSMVRECGLTGEDMLSLPSHPMGG
jgi:histidinol phosphatase-like PHP family hydrolase